LEILGGFTFTFLICCGTGSGGGIVVKDGILFEILLLPFTHIGLI
jgi:hypothetical protein